MNPARATALHDLVMTGFLTGEVNADDGAAGVIDWLTAHRVDLAGAPSSSVFGIWCDSWPLPGPVPTASAGLLPGDVVQHDRKVYTITDIQELPAGTRWLVFSPLYADPYRLDGLELAPHDMIGRLW